MEDLVGKEWMNFEVGS